MRFHGIQLRRFHRDDRGNLGVLLLLTIFALVALIGMVFNTSLYATRREELQNAADAGAYSAASWTSRANNIVAGANMEIVRTASAEALAGATLPTAIQAWIQWLEAVAATAAESLDPFQWEDVFLRGLELGDEFPRLLNFTRKACPAFLKILSLQRNKSALFEYQQALVRSIPGIIVEQNKIVEDHFGADVRLVQPGSVSDAGIKPPLSESRFPHATATFAILDRVAKDREKWADELGRHPYYAENLSGAGDAWETWTNVGKFVVIPFTRHHILADSIWWLPAGEIGLHLVSTDEDRLKYYSVVAVASPKYDQSPRIFLRKYFNSPGTLVAYSQAETREFFEYHPRYLARTYKPWRLFSKGGWNWMPRLATADGLYAALEGDSDLKDFFSLSGASNVSEADLERINHH